MVILLPPRPFYGINSFNEAPVLYQRACVCVKEEHRVIKAFEGI